MSADSETSPLLSPADVRSSNMDTSSANSTHETTPLLSSPAAGGRYDGDADAASISPSLASQATSTKRSRPRWPSIIAMAILAMLAVIIIFVAFFVPAAVEQYAKEAAVLEPTSLSLESITSDGVRARIQANFRLDGSRVKEDGTRRIGRLATWAVRKLGTDETKVQVFLPEFDGMLLGTAAIPPLVLDLVDGHSNAVDFVADLVPGDADGIRMLANQWLRGKLETVRFRGKADLRLNSGFLPLGSHTVTESLVIEANKLPQVPQYNITKLTFQDIDFPARGTRGIAADVALNAFNSFPFQFDIPELGFEVMVPNCAQSDPYILVAAATTRTVHVKPKSEVIVEGRGVVETLPEALTAACPDSNSSPLDHLLDDFLSGDTPTVYVRGAQKPLPSTPGWIAEILSSVTVPVPFPTSGFDSLIREFALNDVHFSLPDTDDPDSNPKVSGTILVSAALPSEMNFEVNVTKIRANADVFFRNRKLGELNVDEWQPANSTQEPATDKREARLQIQSRIVDAPLNVTDDNVLTDVIQRLFMGGSPVQLDVKAAVAVQVHTALGDLTLKDIPAEGKIPVKPLPKGTFGKLKPKIGQLQITDTTYSSVSIDALVNITNPTPYTANIPFVTVHVVSNGSIVGEATAENLVVGLGENNMLVVKVKWAPSHGGDKAAVDGRNLISGFLSGYNTTITLRAHEGSIPGQPKLGRALSRIDLNVSAPHLTLPPKEGGGDSDEDEKQQRFIREATFHVFSSTASFTLFSPLQNNLLYIERINATAYYNHTDPVGTIRHDLPFVVEPGESVTPRLPVEWRLGSDGYDKIRSALGGSLRLDARAVVDVRLGNWREEVWYVGRGIGANIRV
ncbi:hypothetical protein MCOR08_000197 [Pyricularia oryzae]|nr:hypothetical protein MCOR08_000197 [Pyricularia oryzae]